MELRTLPVTASRPLLLALLLAAALAILGPARGAAAAALPLFNTGVDADGVALASGADPHYRLVSSADPDFRGPDAVVALAIAEGSWIPNSAASKWIAPSAMQDLPVSGPCNAAGSYTYRTTFDLTRYDPSTAVVTGRWAVDDVGASIRLNGIPMAVPAAGYDAFTGFTLDRGFRTGVNTLDFEVTNGGCPTGLRVELSGTATLLPPAVNRAVVALAAGYDHTCGLTAAGGVMCWGNSPFHALGIGVPESSVPVDVPGLQAGVIAIAAGDHHTCALTLAGGVKCWGSNGSGQLGDGTTTDRAGPADVVGLASGVVAIAAGDGHTCAVTEGGSAKCWGRNDAGQLGDGRPGVSSAVPVDVVGLSSGVTAISAGWLHSCAVTSGGGLKCWGNNGNGQLGVAGTHFTPVDVTGLTSGVRQASAGFARTCAVLSRGAARCWGANFDGALGDGTQVQRGEPTDVQGLGSGVQSISAGKSFAGHTCALVAGGAKCWGANDQGQVGDGSRSTRLAPVDVPGLRSGVLDVVQGRKHTCAITVAGGVQCWGRNAEGQLGTAMGPESTLPSDVYGLSAPDTSPDPFAFASQSNVQGSTLRTSGAVVPTGYTSPAPVSVVDGEYSVGCGATFTALPGTIAPGQSVCVRHVSSAGQVFSVTTRLTIGGVQGTFTSTTAPVATTSSTLDFGAQRVETTGARVGLGIANFGASPVTILGWGVAGDFSVQSTTCSALLLTPGTGCDFWLVFRPRAAGVRTATFTIATDAGTLEVALTGVGVLDAQVIDFPPLPNRTFGDAAFEVSAAGGGSGNAVRFSSLTSSVCTVAGSTVTLLAAGECTIAADQDGAVGFHPAAQVTRTFLVARSGQSIVFGVLPDRSVGATFTVHATASSGLPVSFGTLTPKVCSVDRTSVTLLDTGACTVTADQPGNASFLPASQARQGFLVTSQDDPADVREVFAGFSHACALTTGGQARCWGGNDAGQLGDGTLTSRPLPAPVPDLRSGVASLAAGGFHTCAVTLEGQVLCWGRNSEGQVGDDSRVQRSVPARVVNLPAAVAVSAGTFHTCALTAAGAVLCWGHNEDGQLGTGDATARTRATPVADLPAGTLAVAAGGSHTCALTAVGGVKCWGDNIAGELGNGTFAPSALPVDVTGLASGVVALAAGNRHTCALTATGGVECWGDNSSGQLGNPGATGGTPVEVSGLASGVVAITAGFGHTCAITSRGALKCWGDNRNGALGDGTLADRPAPVDVAGMASGVVDVSAGHLFTCAATAAGAARCWGNGSGGQLGDGTTGNRSTPGDVTGHTGLDVTPDNLQDITQSDVRIASTRTFTLAPGGFFDAAPISVSGGEYSLGCAAPFTAAPGTIAPGQTVCVRHVASSGYGQVVATTLAIGGAAARLASITAAAPALSVAPAAVAFGEQPVGTTGAGRVVTVTNTSAVNDASGLGWGVVGDFSIASTTCTATLAAGASCTLTVAFTPLAVGGRADELLVFSDNAVPGLQRVVLSGNGIASDTTPAAFSFVDQFLVPTGVVATSAPVQITGLAEAANVSVIGGLWAASSTVSCAGDIVAFTVQPGTIRNGQYVCVRHTTSAVPGGSNDTQLIVGGFGDTFTTVTIDTVPAPFTFPARSGVAPVSTQVSDGALVTGINSAAPVAVAGGEYSVGCSGAFTQAPGSIANGQVVCVRHVAAAAASSARTTTLTIGGVSGAFTTTTAAAPPVDLVTLSVESIDFGGQSLQTTSPARLVRLGNPGAGAITVTGVVAPAHFTATHDCASLAPGAECTVRVSFAPEAAGALSGSLAITFTGGARQVALAGRGERSLTTHYYQSILGRAPDAGGKAFWDGEAARMQAIGVNVNETWFAMTSAFFTSAEYLALARDDAGFVTDLYLTFFDRAPDAGGLDFWAGQLGQGMPREVLLASFVFSAEFGAFTRAIFGDPAARPEDDMVVDFYRGLLARLPDDAGFAHWRAQFRAAQCASGAAVNAQVEAISSAFALSAEHAARNRTPSQYVGDLYNAFLRRGGDLAGVQFWIGEITSGARSREQVRQAFVASAEFQGRVRAVIAAGCLR